MAKVEILVGTTQGGTEYVADDMAAQLTDIGHQTQIHLTPNLTDLDPDSLWLIVCSTHGAGDLPDNIEPFYRQLFGNNGDLKSLKYALCAIGDSSYDTFCQGPEKIISELDRLDAKPIVNKIQIDVQRDPVPEDAALAWLSEWQASI
ncbi:FMN-binding protein MioC [Shewanella sp. 10N.286.51.B7]|uniref:FMN-binding protein MioC n=1 Tax=Shewanella sp. 10N.286.51.B7 TaxID=1880836 RepID=UPI000C81F237|nr:FMN-binding protein MioC [Shewanella sp. 10N.286.51.B7]PMG74899.1 FMN-binding protein MioC [Shewanella sp. 10N.286.51.B7]